MSILVDDDDSEEVARTNARLLTQYNNYASCRNPHCHLIEATRAQNGNLPNSLFRPLYKGQEYCCIECERNHYRIDTDCQPRKLSLQNFPLYLVCLASG